MTTQFKQKVILALSLFTFLSAKAADEVIEFPEDELAQETVLPKFDRPDVVKSRSITTADKMELAPFFGFVTTEPIYGPLKFGLNLAYHWSEDSDLSFNFAKFSGGLNTVYTDSLANQYKLDFSRAPKQNYAAFVNYEFKAYYGKISFTKQGVMNLSTYPLAGLGIIAYEHKSYPALDFGVGQKFYFSKTVSLRLDFKFQYAQGPSPFLNGRMKTPPTTGTAGPGNGDTVPLPGEFADKWAINNVIDLGVSFLF
jgi:outer membrane beta-barrel protein